MDLKLLLRVKFIALLLACIPLASAQAAEVANDLPGSPWVGPAVSTTVGGSIYDRVWKLDLTVGKVAVIQTAGGAGAELGLYLFDSEVSSIYSDRPLKSSALPGGKQTIVASLPAGTYYVNVNGRNIDRAYAFTLNISLFSDPTPPELSPQVADGQTRVSSDFVTILSRATDGLSGVSGLRFRFSSAEWSEWSDKVDKISIPLPGVEGTYSIELQAKNGLDLISQTKFVTIVVDKTAPFGILLGPVNGGSVTTSFPVFTYRFNEEMSEKAMIGSIVLTDFLGNSIGGVTRISSDRLKATFKPSTPLELGRQYAINIVGATDLAGNIVESTGGKLFAYREKTAIRPLTRSYIATYGQVLEFRGSEVNIPKNSSLQIEFRKPNSQEWVKVGTAVARNGIFVGQFNPVQSGEYRITYSGELTRAASSSGRIRVSLFPALLLNGAGAKPKERRAGAVITFTGLVNPLWASVELQRLRCNSNFTSCRLVERMPLSVSSDGTVTTGWRALVGNWKFRLTSKSSDELVGFKTKFLLLRVK